MTLTTRSGPIEDQPPSEPGAAEITDPRRRRAVLAAMVLALVAVVASVSGLNVAQGALAADLGATQSELLWIINGYTVALAALLLPVGAIGDRYGRRRVLLVGLAGFVASSAFAATATTVVVLLAARIGAGISAAMIMPVTLSVITTSFPPVERPKAIGVWAAFAGAGGVIGLRGSAAVIDAASWPWVFAIPAGFALVAAAVTARTVPESRDSTDHLFDIPGAVSSAVAVGALVLAIHEGPEAGWTNPITLAALAVGSAALVAFVIAENRHPHPLLDVAIFADRRLAAGSLTLLTVFAVMFGVFLAIIQYLQAVLGYGAFTSALALMPLAAAMMPTSAFAPSLAARVGERRTISAGLATLAAGLGLLALLVDDGTTYLAVVPGLVLTGIGAGLTMTPATTAITSSLPQERQGVASAINDTAREIGGAVGVALLGSILNAAYRTNLTDIPDAAADAARDGIGSALATASELPGVQGQATIEIARSAFVDGFGTALTAAAALTLLTLGAESALGRISSRSARPVDGAHSEPR